MVEVGSVVGVVVVGVVSGDNLRWRWFVATANHWRTLEIHSIVGSRTRNIK